jgi:uncharacterized membrane protein
VEHAEPTLAEELGVFVYILEMAAFVTEIFAILILLNGLVRFMVIYLRSETGFGGPGGREAGLNAGRVDLSRYILAGLEVFIVSDIIRTVLSPTLDKLAVLASLVVIRSIISFFLSREIREIEEKVPQG